MLSDDEKRVISRYPVWNYSNVPSGFKMVDLYLSNPFRNAMASSNRISTERIMNFIYFESQPGFCLNFHIFQDQDINYLMDCLTYIEKSQVRKKTEVFIHVRGNIEIIHLLPVKEQIVFSIEEWKRLYQDKSFPEETSRHKIIIKLHITPDSLEYIHDSIYDLCRKGCHIFLTRFDPRPKWQEKDLRALEDTYIRLSDLYVSSVKEKKAFVWDEIEERLYRFLRYPSFSCGMGEEFIALYSNGSIYPCRFLLEKENRRDIIGEVSQGLHYRLWGNAKPNIVHHHLYCCFECSHLRAGIYPGILFRYNNIIDKVSERIIPQIIDRNNILETISRPDTGISTENVALYYPFLPGSLQSTEKMGEEKDPLEYDDIYLHHMRWAPRLRHLRKRERR